MSNTQAEVPPSLNGGGTQMSDLQMTKLCAEAMGLRLLPAYPKDHSLYRSYHDKDGLMVSENHYFIQSGAYTPIEDDAQAMALVKEFELEILHNHFGEWMVARSAYTDTGENANLNRAIVECIAKMQVYRTARENFDRGNQ